MKFTKTTTLLYTCLLAGFQLVAQTKIDIHFPQFAHEAYVFSLSKGARQDTILSASFDAQGKTQIQIPAQHQDYVGVAQLRIENSGGVDIILNHEPHITIQSVSDDSPELRFQGSAENTDLSTRYKIQQELFRKGQAMLIAAGAYTPKDKLSPILDQERIQLEKDYAAFMQEEERNPLYAARLRKMQYFLGDVGSTLTQEQPERIENFRRYFREELDYQKAYTSGLWRDLWGSWMAMHQQAIGLDSILMDDCQAILNYIPNDTLKKAWLSSMIPQFARYGKDRKLMELGIDNLISAGTHAPLLQLQMKRQILKNAILVFHESGCHSCEQQMLQVYHNYPVIKELGYEVFSVSADTDEDVFISNTYLLPWQEKYCDYQGFQGENFRNYGVYGTPTIFVIDNEGIITGRYARLEEMEILTGTR